MFRFGIDFKPIRFGYLANLNLNSRVNCCDRVFIGSKAFKAKNKYYSIGLDNRKGIFDIFFVFFVNLLNKLKP